MPFPSAFPGLAMTAMSATNTSDPFRSVESSVELLTRILDQVQMPQQRVCKIAMLAKFLLGGIDMYLSEAKASHTALPRHRYLLTVAASIPSVPHVGRVKLAVDIVCT